jgi:hypothetical protein
VFTYDEIMILLEALGHKYGPGYSTNKTVGPLQAKLSIMAEVKRPAGAANTFRAGDEHDVTAGG